MKPHKFLLLAAAAAVVAERAEPTAHFILLATQRTGSTWVMSELSKHSSCIATGTELFLDHKGFTWTESSRVRCLKTLYGSDVDKKQKPHKCSPKFKQFRSEVRAFAARQNRSSLPAVVGWKYLLNAGVPKHKSNIGGMMRDWPWLKRMWKHRGVKVLFLRRRNHLATVVSRASNFHSHNPHPSAEELKRVAQKKVKLETSGRWEKLRQLKNVKNAYSELGHLRDKARAAGLETRMVTYEDLAANATAFAQLANWLQGGGSKCPSAALDSSREVDGPGARAVLKIHSKRLNETVLNWNVVVKTLTGTEFERFLHDDA